MEAIFKNYWVIGKDENKVVTARYIKTVRNMFQDAKVGYFGRPSDFELALVLRESRHLGNQVYLNLN